VRGTSAKGATFEAPWGIFGLNWPFLSNFWVQELGRRDKCPSPKYATGYTLAEAGSVLTELSHDDVLKSPRT